MGDNPQCIANLKEEIHTLQGENNVLYEKIKRMESNWDALIKQTTLIEASRSKLEWDISRIRGELLAKTSLLQQLDLENNELQASLAAHEEKLHELNNIFNKKVEELHSFQTEFNEATERHALKSKAWKEEKRSINKQKEEIARKLDACEDELHSYHNENAKLEKHLKQVLLSS